MAKAFSDYKSDKDISFSSQSYLSNNSSWSTIEGSVSYGSTIVMNNNSAMMANIDLGGMKCNYLKLQIHLTADDKSLTTDNFHAVSGLYEVTVQDENGVTKTNYYEFYPKYDFEDSYKDDFTTVSLSSAVKVKNITVTIYNDEDLAIKITNTGIYVSAIVDPESIKEIVDDYVPEVIPNIIEPIIQEDVPPMIEEIISSGTVDLVIPLINSIDEMNSKPDGAIARCAWIRGNTV